MTQKRTDYFGRNKNVGATLVAIQVGFATKVAPTWRASTAPKTALCCLLLALFAMPSMHAKEPQEVEPQYQVAVCDWMILKRQKLGAFARTHEIGADGIELDMGGLGNRPTFDSKLMDPLERRKFRDEIAKYDLEVCAMAMSGFYAQSFAEREGVLDMVRDTINTMEIMDVKTVFLPLGVANLVERPELRPVVVERLKEAAKMAEASGIVIGLETAYDSAGNVQLLEDIGSPNIKIFFNFSIPLEAGLDLIEEIKILGKDRICMFHATDKDGVWLENNERLDMQAVKACLDEMGWSGWLVVERSRDQTNPREVMYNFPPNVRYLKKVFQGQ